MDRDNSFEYDQFQRSGIRKKLPPQSKDILKNWFSTNIDNPYPSPEVKEELCKLTNLTMRQLQNWFTNARKRSQEFHKRDRRRQKVANSDESNHSNQNDEAYLSEKEQPDSDCWPVKKHARSDNQTQSSSANNKDSTAVSSHEEISASNVESSQKINHNILKTSGAGASSLPTLPQIVDSAQKLPNIPNYPFPKIAEPSNANYSTLPFSDGFNNPITSNLQGPIPYQNMPSKLAFPFSSNQFETNNYYNNINNNNCNNIGHNENLFGPNSRFLMQNYPNNLYSGAFVNYGGTYPGVPTITPITVMIPSTSMPHSQSFNPQFQSSHLLNSAPLNRQSASSQSMLYKSLPMESDPAGQFFPFQTLNQGLNQINYFSGLNFQNLLQNNQMNVGGSMEMSSPAKPYQGYLIGTPYPDPQQSFPVGIPLPNSYNSIEPPMSYQTDTGMAMRENKCPTSPSAPPGNGVPRLNYNTINNNYYNNYTNYVPSNNVESMANEDHALLTKHSLSTEELPNPPERFGANSFVTEPMMSSSDDNKKVKPNHKQRQLFQKINSSTQYFRKNHKLK
eukprot:TRINITY_DN9801_c0_g1_i2.p1 TRINITY_DN9801_c0_g1~~TRINITY_DN9801_c0_g1_i2.p1  ORF type:complete len:562 (+),score=74.56 TRINITY_DN9801_c0_g1_i2:350-2035(+)